MREFRQDKQDGQDKNIEFKLLTEAKIKERGE